MSELKDTTVTGIMKLNKIITPMGPNMKYNGVVISSDLGLGNADNTLTYTNPMSDTPLMWSGTFADSITDNVTAYYKPGTQGTSTPQSTTTGTTTTGNQKSFDTTVSSGSAFFWGSVQSSTLYPIPLNGSTEYRQVVVPVGKSVKLDFTLTAPDYLLYTPATPIQSCMVTSRSSSVYLTVSSASAVINPKVANSNLLYSEAFMVPYKTTDGSANGNDSTISYTCNNISGSSNVTIYVRVTGIGGGPALTNIRTANYAVTSGTLRIYLKASCAMTTITPASSTPSTPEEFPAGKPLHKMGTTGYVMIDSNGNMTLDLPSTYYVKRGSKHMRITSSGLQTSSDGKTWTSK